MQSHPGENVARENGARRRRFQRTGNPPPNTSVRVGCFDPSVLRNGEDLPENEMDAADFGIPAPYYDAFSFSCISHLYGLLWETVIGGLASVEPLIDATKGDRRLIRLWPQDGSELTWPPDVLLPRRAHPQLCAAWKHSPDMYDSGWARPEAAVPPGAA